MLPLGERRKRVEPSRLTYDQLGASTSRAVGFHVAGKAKKGTTGPTTTVAARAGSVKSACPSAMSAASKIRKQNIHLEKQLLELDIESQEKIEVLSSNINLKKKIIDDFLAEHMELLQKPEEERTYDEEQDYVSVRKQLKSLEFTLANLEEELSLYLKSVSRKREGYKRMSQLEIASIQVDEDEAAERALDSDDEERVRLWDLQHANSSAPQEPQTQQQQVLDTRSPTMSQRNDRVPLREYGNYDSDPDERESVTHVPANVDVNQKMIDLMNAQLSIMSSSQHKQNHYVERDLPVFTGKPEEWIGFESQYERTTRRYNFDDTDNLYRLRKALKGEAWEAVKFFCNSPNNVGSIMATLQQEFGRPGLVIESLIMQVEKAKSPEVHKPETVVEFARAVQSLVASIKGHQQNDYLNNIYLLNKLTDKMSTALKWDWLQFCKNVPGQVKDLMLFESWITMKKEMACELCKPKSENKTEERKPKRGPAKIMVAAAEEEKVVDDNTTKKAKCLFCSKPGHILESCWKFSRKKSKDKWSFVKEKRLCYLCLDVGHRTDTCEKGVACDVNGCGKSHHKILHFTPEAEKPQVAEVTAPPSTIGVTVVKGTDGPLPIVQVAVRGPNGVFKTHALLDQGSTATVMENDLAAKLGVTGEKVNFSCRGYGGNVVKENNSMSVDVDIRGTVPRSQFVTLKNVITVEDIGLAPYSLDVDEAKRLWPQLKRMKAASMKQVKPQLIIGSKHRHLSIPREILCSSLDGPVATRTQLGWVLEGNLQNSHLGSQMFCLTSRMESDDALHETIKLAFKVEDFGIKPVQSLHSINEKKALKIMEDTASYHDGKWQIGLLWKDPNLKLPSAESKNNALKRLVQTEKRMNREPLLREAYDKKISEYVSKGYVRRLSIEESLKDNSKAYYVPHFGVLNPNKPGKFRLVFDCASRVGNECFNDKVHTGPDLLRPITSVLWNFRRHTYVISGDIEDMFHRIGIVEHDQHAQRFLWRDEEKADVETYQMQVMLFGNTSSPSCANYIKARNADMWLDKYPEACRAIKEDFYMDDALTGGDTIVEVINLRKQINEIHAAGNMCIKKWMSNNDEILESIPKDLQLSGVKLVNDKSLFPAERVLGLWWNPKEDCFSFKLNFHKVNDDVLNGARPTKRQMASMVMSIYDPLGFLGHFKVKGMMLLQSTWTSGIGWDDEVGDDIYQNWKVWMQDLQRITEVSIPRCYDLNLNSADYVELHTLVDASEQGFCALSYFRIVRGADIKLSLVASKIKVAPLKKLTIPRLELQAAVLGANLANTIIEEVRVPVKKKYFWSDSSTVLSWIRSPSSKFQEFVANRIGRIQEITDVAEWRWVPTDENVADDATRLKLKTDFSVTARWFCGPSFLTKSEDDWPTERRIETQMMVVDVDVVPGDALGISPSISEGCGLSAGGQLLPKIENFSSFTRLVRATAAVTVAARYWRNKFKAVPLVTPWSKINDKLFSNITADDLKEAEIKLLKSAQKSCYPLEDKKATGLSKLKQLNPAYDEDGLLRAQGRIKKAKELPYDQKYPIILPPKHHLTYLLIDREHRLNGHTGQQTVLANLRKKYWIVDGGQEVKRCWSRCMTCRIARAKPIPAAMGDLPSYRLATHSPPFSYTGVDYFGPMEVTVGRRREKRWGVLFTDLVTRGVHIEVAHRLTTDEMILSLSRFVDARGRPKLIVSDNGTNFVGAVRELKEAVSSINYQRIMEEQKFQDINWKFIPPASPHFGGVWERMVQCVKKVIMATLREKYPRDTTLLTVLKGAENVVNSRPLSPLSTDVDDEEALTPNHFLRGNVNMGPSIPVELDKRDEFFRNRWRYSQILTEQFWRRWTAEVVPLLMKREKWNEPRDPVEEGDIVLLVDDQLPRNCWVKAVVTKTFPGEDGIVRVVEVTKRFGAKPTVYRRSIMKICPLGLRVGKTGETAPVLGAGNVGA